MAWSAHLRGGGVRHRQGETWGGGMDGVERPFEGGGG
jgi:hypothetical protein